MLNQMGENNQYVALLRSINVGGKNRIIMKQLISLLEANGFSRVKTYIQSGNIVFASKQTDQFVLSKKIRNIIFENYNFKPNVQVLSADEVEQAANNNPFKQAEENAKSLHLFFLEQTAIKPDFNKIDEIKLASENYSLIGRTFYLHTPDGFGRSKLASRVEKLLGVNCTARNWQTIMKIIELAY